MHHGASLWLFLDGCSAKRQKQKPNGRQKKAQKPPVFSAKIGPLLVKGLLFFVIGINTSPFVSLSTIKKTTGHRNPSPNHGSPFSHGHAKSKHKLAGMEKECTKTIAKQKSRPKATDVGAFIRGPLLYGTIRHQGQQKEKAGPHRKMRPPIGKDTKNNTDQFSRTAGA